MTKHAGLRNTNRRGFTLAELIVATTLLSIVMVSVYTVFQSALRVSALGEDHLHLYQDMRNALSSLDRELNCVMSGTDHLFQGANDAFEFFALTQPLDVRDSKGARVLWIRYRFNRSTKTLYREEAHLEAPLPVLLPGETTAEPSRIHLGRKHKLEFVSNVRAFRVEYYWVPTVLQEPGVPPEPTDPIMLAENRQGWGLPAAVRITITLEDPNTETGRSDFSTLVKFQCPTTPYDPDRVGVAGGARS